MPVRHPRLHEPRPAAGRRSRSRERHLFIGRRVLRDAHEPAAPRGDDGCSASNPAAAAPAHAGALAPPDRPSRIGGGGRAGPPSRPGRALAVGAGVRASGGAGGGIRTRKGFRPETCEVSAFTSFATPAPRWLRTLASPKANTLDPARAANRQRKVSPSVLVS